MCHNPWHILNKVPAEYVVDLFGYFVACYRIAEKLLSVILIKLRLGLSTYSTQTA